MHKYYRAANSIKTISFVFSIFFFGTIALFAQDSSGLHLQKVELSKTFLPYQNPFQTEKPEKDAGRKLTKKELTELDKELLQRMSKIYELQIKAMQAQVQNDPLNAEENILEALRAIKNLLDDYPEIKGNKRFAQLYSTVYTEYRQFYGIEEPVNEVVGEVFAVRKELATSDYNWELAGYQFPENISMPNLEVPLIQNEQVKRHLLYYTQRRPEVMQKWLERTEKYFPMMRKIFKEVGVPTELIHLSMIESGLNPVAESWASAMGMWQFMEATGAAYGLDVNWWVDERRDPEKATWAAARHLKDLYDRWNNWHLAIAGYNISPRGLISAIRQGGGERDYWSAWAYLPNETQGYVPGFVAATMITLNPEKFGFDDYYAVEPYDYDIAEVAPLMPLDLLAEAAGISTEKLKAFNPELLRWATPPGSPYELKLPAGIKDKFLVNYNQIPEDARSQSIVMHTVQSGQTLGHIARRYGTTVRVLYETNEGLSSLIYPGQRIVVPLPGGGSGNIASATATTERQSDDEAEPAEPEPSHSGTAVYYTVKSGDTIGHIAEWYDVRASQIRAWNNTSNLINVGDRLTIYVPEDKEAYYNKVEAFSLAKKRRIEQEQGAGKEITAIYVADTDASTDIIEYLVQSNDTLIEIAQAFNVSVSSIKEMNGLEGSRIYVGQLLRIQTLN